MRWQTRRTLNFMVRLHSRRTSRPRHKSQHELHGFVGQSNSQVRGHGSQYEPHARDENVNLVEASYYFGFDLSCVEKNDDMQKGEEMFRNIDLQTACV